MNININMNVNIYIKNVSYNYFGHQKTVKKSDKENIFARYLSKKRFVSKIYKELLQSSKKNRQST